MALRAFEKKLNCRDHTTTNHNHNITTPTIPLWGVSTQGYRDVGCVCCELWVCGL